MNKIDDKPTESTAKHTPVPRTRCKGGGFSTLDDMWNRIQHSSCWREDAFYDDGATPTSLANDAFIVRACNSHEQLLAVLAAAEAVVASFESDDGWKRDSRTSIDLSMNQLRSAIAAAKGGEA